MRALALLALLAGGCYRFLPSGGELRKDDLVVRLSCARVAWITSTRSDRPSTALRPVCELDLAAGAAHEHEQLNPMSRAFAVFGPAAVTCGAHRVEIRSYSERGAWLRVAR